MFSLAKHSSWLHKLLLLFMIRGGATRFMEGMVSSLPQVDKDILSGMEKGEENIAESFRCGIKGPAWDQYILARPWGFCLEGINVAVRLWQGDQDVMVPPSMGQYLAKRLTQCQAAFCAGEGHMLIFPRWDEILTALAG
jgi:pimeloyl-ACP methyl ester carboxylesterase